MTKYEALVTWALGEVGYREGANNDNKYGIEYGMNHQPYCLIFVWIAHKRVGVTLPRIASCGDMGDWYLEYKPKCILKKPKLGCFILYKWGHAGIFLSDNGNGTITTVEANTSAGKSNSQSNGDGVYVRTDRTYSDVRFFIDGINEANTPAEKPKEVTEVRYNTYEEMPSWAKPTIRKLIEKGYLQGNGTVKDAYGFPADLNLSYDMIRMFVINDRAGIYG